jgi:hypothetical protein
MFLIVPPAKLMEVVESRDTAWAMSRLSISFEPLRVPRLA